VPHWQQIARDPDRVRPKPLPSLVGEFLGQLCALDDVGQHAYANVFYVINCPRLDRRRMADDRQRSQLGERERPTSDVQ
jgi:hypothetical protein